MSPPWMRRTVIVLLSPLGLLIISVSRLLIVARYNSTTATAIASSGGYVNTLLGTAMPLVPVFLPYLAIVFLFYRRFLLGLLTLAAAALVSPTRLKPLISKAAWKDAAVSYETWIERHIWLILLITVILFAVARFVHRDLREDYMQAALADVRASGKSFQQAAADHGVSESSLRRRYNGGADYTVPLQFIAVLITACLLPYLWNTYPIPRIVSYYSTLISQPWLPAEVITVKSGAPVVGYTLSANDTWVIILEARPRIIRYVPASDVTGRFVCRTTPQNLIASNSSPLIPLPNGKNSQPPPCWGPGSPGQPIQLARTHASEWTVTKVTTSSTVFRHIPSFNPAIICAVNQVSATLSAEISGGPAGFRIKVNDGSSMNPGAVRFVPAGPHDSFSFTFTRKVSAINNKNRHTFVVQWRSPIGAATTLERASLNLQYHRSTQGC